MVRRRSTVLFRNGAPQELTCEARSEAHWTALILHCGWELSPYWEESGRSCSAGQCAGQQSSPDAQPRRDAAAASSVRELTFSLAKTCERWVFTVPAPMNRRLPISGFVKPCAASSTTCSSVGVRLSHPVAGRLRLPLARRA